MGLRDNPVAGHRCPENDMEMSDKNKVSNTVTGESIPGWVSPSKVSLS